MISPHDKYSKKLSNLGAQNYRASFSRGSLNPKDVIHMYRDISLVKKNNQIDIIWSFWIASIFFIWPSKFLQKLILFTQLPV